ncbi:MAG: hypothetical protein R2856_05805 [Caldilineaceae bacterium]
MQPSSNNNHNNNNNNNPTAAIAVGYGPVMPAPPRRHRTVSNLSGRINAPGRKGTLYATGQ